MNISKISTYQGVQEQEFLQIYREINAYPRTGKTVEVTADQGLTYGDSGLVYLSPAAPTNIDLPPATRRGTTYKLKRKGNPATAVTITPDGTDTIDFAAGAYTVDAVAGACVVLEADGISNWVMT